MKRNILYRICGTLFSLSALAACGLEPQEECLPCNGKLRYTEVHMEGAPSAAGFATPALRFPPGGGNAGRIPLRPQLHFGRRRRNAQATAHRAEKFRLPFSDDRPARRRGVAHAEHGGRHHARHRSGLGRPAAGMRRRCSGAGRVRRLYRPERRSHSARRKHPSHADAYRRTGAFRHLPYGRLAVTARKHRFARHGVGDRPGIPDRNHL